ncbi:MAG: hypothetical protein HOC63_05400 [Rhodospirillales bacterium]|nr:hypothetical protein [Rhodospirillales bacterium]MBT4626109.1 hypothetical protein [Rhodospirillales bacterium]MBT5522249.1 hypothetical protein [Rhodospirillales bacterium]MBT6109368.1 hypothetical protein [Rhodospirillales bacterium]MBT7777630.1 hypothetical protein [Rhodospirillales bacterium]
MSQSLPHKSDNPVDVLLLSILGLALVVRLIALWALPDIYMPDSADYLVDGTGLFQAGQIPGHKYMPLYSILAYITGGETSLKIADVTLSTLTVWMIYKIVNTVFQVRSAAIIAALIAAGYPHFVFYSIIKLSETLYLFLTCWAFLLLYERKLFWGAALLILSIMTRPTVYILAPILIFGFSKFIWREPTGRSFRNVAIYLTIYLAIMSPWWLHNYEKYDAFVHLTLGDGLVLYSGNNPINVTGGGVAIDGVGDMNTAAFKDISDLIARNQAYKDAAIDYIVEDPAHFVYMAGVKFVRFWRLWPFAPEYQQSHIIVASILSYGTVLFLSLGFFFRRPSNQIIRAMPFMLFAAYLTAVHMVTIGSIRYRLPVEPFLIVLASITLKDVAYRFSYGRQLLAHLGIGEN